MTYSINAYLNQPTGFTQEIIEGPSVTNTIEEAYELGRKHKAASLSNVYAILQFIQSQDFTCDQLHQIALGLEDIKGSDYDDGIGYDDSDRSDELREYRDNQ